MGLHARLMSQALRKITAAVARSNTLVMFVNQIRMNLGVMFGNPETTTGGKALKFYSSVRVEVRRRAQIKQGERIVGNRVVAKVVKNKVAAPLQVAEFDIMYNEGISKESDIVDAGVRFGALQKSGSWVLFGTEKIGQGREQAKQFLKQHPDITSAVLKALKERAAAGEAGAPATTVKEAAVPVRENVTAIE
jgi:recombination protein RecA